MPITIQNSEGEDMEVFTAQELADQKASAVEEAVKPIKEDHEKLQRIHAQQADNIKLLKNMTEEEKNKLSASEIEQRRVAELALEENAALKARLDDNDKRDLAQKKEAAIKGYVGDDKALREKLESQMGKLAIDDINELVAAAATLAGINTQNVNPLTQHMDGQPPRQFNSETVEAQKKEFFDSEKGKAALAELERLG